MSILLGDARSPIERLPAGSIRRRIAFALLARQGRWVTTEELIDIAYAHRPDGGPRDAKGVIKITVHQLRGLLPGYTIEGHAWRGRRLIERKPE